MGQQYLTLMPAPEPGLQCHQNERGSTVPLSHVAALAAGSVLAGLAVFQALLIAGAPLGRFAWGGQHRVLPRKLRISSAISIITYGLFGYAALARAGLAATALDGNIQTVIMWLLTAYFALGVVLNGISRSRPERFTMTPVALVLAAFYLILALH